MNRIYMTLTFLMLVFAGCSSSINVSTDHDPATDFSGYKTFAVSNQVSAGSSLEKYPLIKDRVIKAVQSEMRQKDYVHTWLDKADFVVFPFAGPKENINVNAWGYSAGGNYWGMHPYGKDIDISTYSDASIVLDVVDNKTHQLVWRGIGSTVVRPYNTPEDRAKNIDEAIDKILAQFPRRI